MSRGERRSNAVELLEDEQPDELRPVRVRRRFRHRHPVIVALLVGAAGVAVAAGWAGAADGSGSQVSALGREQRSSDVLPEALAEGLVATSARRLASDGDATFWVALNGEDRYCFVATISGLGAAGSACADESGLGRGVLLSINCPGTSVAAVLISDGTETPSVPGSWEQVSENVFVRAQ
ncbi:hypothetical protein [Pengzhenrongella frigida]|uniref:Uncharacterized protein n=1 Tax=Pengzhenrongella frigida TaxID=1259133 RepID=A0A4Q5MYH2_9MICO|nr:hypothetical protein [Cellulomonas sp. HLT2-17]RYV49287.1 hypothetical protein EUA98_19615 [Cellulomonas sp. HLT2-17]